MKVFLSAFLALFFSLPSYGLETWERCMDERDFDFNANSFTNSSRVMKSGCRYHFVELGGKGKKFEIDICDPRIHIDQFNAIDTQEYFRAYAGSSGCPAPLFGADFAMPKEQKGAAEFIAARKKVLEITEFVRKMIAPNITKDDAEKLKDAPPYSSEAQVACGLFLIYEYLENCVSFEPKPKTEENAKKSDIPGIHPQTITAPEKGK